jgi:hypothetical protein
MKMKPTDFAALTTACNAVLAKHPQAKSQYETFGFSHKRFRWDVLSQSGFATNSLYSYLSDDHIDTALRRIIPPFKGGDNS